MIVICNGMLRSGSTLQYNIAACAMETTGPLNRVGFLGGLDRPDARARLETLKADDAWSIVKTHDSPLEPGFYSERVRVLFSFRDVRDIAASIRKKWRHPFEQILSEIDAMIEVERQFDEIPNVLVQSYSDLFNDPAGATQQIAGHLGTALGDDDCARIVSQNAADDGLAKASSRSRILTKCFQLVHRRAYDRRTLLHADHISPSGGRDGDWLNQFSPTEQATLNSRYERWLSSHGLAVNC